MTSHANGTSNATDLEQRRLSTSGLHRITVAGMRRNDVRNQEDRAIDQHPLPGLRRLQESCVADARCRKFIRLLPLAHMTSTGMVHVPNASSPVPVRPLREAFLAQVVAPDRASLAFLSHSCGRELVSGSDHRQAKCSGVPGLLHAYARSYILDIVRRCSFATHKSRIKKLGRIHRNWFSVGWE